ncbi:hypothetical protein pdul_cds_149 [Pandoravirus dulcis]|uniref:Uncharacterized protein n=1 Tax=Pandoravirus dulcis TaxID=1349409 RepID=S4VVU7_9VIRU|nr:hypothetical protein pdul_cds_149 [Pandoravirus dulcis]AGO82069.1 hypothetical protein pdul_cds_149 [Pandoravirus dulcis]
MSSTDPQRRRSTTTTSPLPKRKAKPTPFSSSRVMVSTKKADAALRTLKERQKAMRRQESGRVPESHSETSPATKKETGAATPPPAAEDREPSRPAMHILQQPDDVAHDDGMAKQLAAVAAAVDAISRRLAAHECAIMTGPPQPPAEDRPLQVIAQTGSLPCEAVRSTSRTTPHNNESGGLGATVDWLHTHGAHNLDTQARINAASGSRREVVDYLYKHHQRHDGDEAHARANDRTADVVDRQDRDDVGEDEQNAPRPMPRIIVLPADYVSMPSVTPATSFWWE